MLEDYGVKLFSSLFELYPNLLDLFPFKDAKGQPIIDELKVHGLKVASTFGEVVERLQNVEAMDRWGGGGRAWEGLRGDLYKEEVE